MHTRNIKDICLFVRPYTQTRKPAAARIPHKLARAIRSKGEGTHNAATEATTPLATNNHALLQKTDNDNNVTAAATQRADTANNQRLTRRKNLGRYRPLVGTNHRELKVDKAALGLVFANHDSR
jgi:hypothetical protein